ncbi:hypothetical protein XENOCAPTIV_005681 [Xenoophorus captivus]|uniref:Uncharacterized protein n=1 Tax=Xenoophorus captivus TaxID=1517983 RepID=A0ABV0S5C5_9TELE
MYLGYTTTLASFLSLEFSRLNQQGKSHQMQVHVAMCRPFTEMLLLGDHVCSFLMILTDGPDGERGNKTALFAVGSCCSHPQLPESHPALRSILSRCHAILEDDVRWEEDEGAGQRDVPLTNGVDGCHSMRLECWSCSPVRRKSFRRDQATLSQPAHNCGPACCSLLTPDATGWGENSDSGQGTFSHPTMKSTNDLETPHANHSLEGCETDPDDTSAFDYSSVTSCSPDGTLCRDMMMDTNSGEDDDDDDEEDSQVPVLLKPSYSRQQQEQQEQHSTVETRGRTVCVRWQIPRFTPHPPFRSPAGPYVDGPTPCLISSFGKRLVSVRKGSPPPHLKSAFRPIWDDPSKQVSKCLLVCLELLSVRCLAKVLLTIDPFHNFRVLYVFWKGNDT